jgi:hypothetical protein
VKPVPRKSSGTPVSEDWISQVPKSIQKVCHSAEFTRKQSFAQKSVSDMSLFLQGVLATG